MVRGGGPHRGEGPRYMSGNLYLLERHSMPLFSTPSLLPPFLLLRVFSFSLFLPSVVRAPCSSRSRPLPRGPIQPLLLCSYYQAHGSRPNRKLGIYALFQIDLLYLILIRPVAHSYSNSPSRGSTLLREPFFFFLIDRFPPGYRSRTLFSFFRFQRNSSLLAVGRAREITRIDRSPRDNASIPFFVSRFLHQALRSLRPLTLLQDRTDAGVELDSWR